MDWRGDKLLLLLHFTEIKGFEDLIGRYALDDGGLDVTLLSNGIAVDLIELCENEDIDPESIRVKEVWT
ncbi:hypothetical protein [Brevibacillus brevis]|uniref:hypothetical protein n=1 Tax=Brevibacillus brevis TaxID=1393 RepID=UPI0021AD7F3A|nr:hypothetical protein [Brevibacillus brevis]